MTAAQMLDVLRAAMAATDARRSLFGRKRRRVVLSLRAPQVLGYHGKPDGTDAQGVPVWGYTYRQCEAIYDTIIAAIREDIDSAGAPDPGLSW